MEAEFLRRLAGWRRELMRRARTEPGREQLRVWAEEFEQRADVLDSPLANRQPNPSDCRGG